MTKTLMVGLALALAAPVRGQTTAPTGGTVPAAAPQDVASVDGIIAALYDVISGPAGQARSWDRFRSLFVPEAKLIPTGFPEGGTRARARYLSVEDYITGSGPSLQERGFYEREIGRVVERFENIVHAFSSYESRRTADGEVIQRGINSIQLTWDGERWWVANIMWRGVGPSVEVPRKYLQWR